MSQDKIDILKRALSREKAARKQAEKILENKAAELYHAKQELEQSYLELESLLKKIYLTRKRFNYKVFSKTL
jgi:hypothetical protein